MFLSSNLVIKTNKFNFVNLFNQSRCFSTSIYRKNTVDNDSIDLDSINIGDYDKSLVIEKIKAVKEFKNKFKGGYLGYNKIHHFGNISNYTNLVDMAYLDYSLILENKIKEYLDEIPENMIFSVLPIFRWQDSDGEYKSITLTNAIKVTRYTSRYFKKKILHSIQEALQKYDIRNLDIDFFLLSRPWLSAEDFLAGIPEVSMVFEGEIEKEISSFLNVSEQITHKDKSKLKLYEYNNILIDNYGEPIYNKENILIGYKLNKTDYVSVYTYTNEHNLICNKVSLREFDEDNLSFITKDHEVMVYWVDIKTESGFIREFNKKRYFYDKNNKLINVELDYPCPHFPISNKDNNLNTKIGTIDFETYGDNLGTGYHNVFAGGWAIKDNINLFYIKKSESGEQFINRVFSTILMDKSFNGYTFYAHNLGRFDSVFIIKSLINNKNINLTLYEKIIVFYL